MTHPALAHAYVRPILRSACAAVRDGARRVVTSAEHGAIDKEAIHDYRVALRKLRTLLKAAEPLYKRRPMERLAEGLRRFARAAGAVRDEEVLAETLHGITLPAATRARVDAWLATRARKERELRAEVVKQLTPIGDLPRTEGSPEGATEAREPSAAPARRARIVSPPPAARSLPMSLSHALTLAQELPLRERAGHIATRSLAVRALGRAERKVRDEAAVPELGTPDTFHELRIRWKGVRYTAELLGRAVAKSGPHADALANRMKVAVRMQKRLGDLHDLDEAIAAVSRARTLTAGDRMVVHHQLRTARRALEEWIARELPGALALLTDDAARAAL